MKSRRKFILGIGMGVVLLILLAVGIFLRQNYRSKKNIQTVIEQILNCPNEELQNAFILMQEAALNRAKLSDQLTIVESSPTNIELELQKMFLPYISFEWFDSFVNHYYNEFIFYSIAEGYETKIENIEISQSKSIPTNYSFVVNMAYGKTGESKKAIEFEGSAQISKEDGKISYLRFFPDKEFMLEMRNAIP